MISALFDIVGYPFVDDQYIWQSDAHFQRQWKDPSSYEVISVHHETGFGISNATIGNDDDVLFSLGDDTRPLSMATHRPESIHFDHVKVILDFYFLVDVKDQPCHVKIKFFVSLP